MSFPPQIPLRSSPSPTSLTLCSSFLSRQTNKPGNKNKYKKSTRNTKTKSKQMGKRLIGEKLSKQNKTKSPHNTIKCVTCILCCLTHAGGFLIIAWLSGSAQRCSQLRWLGGSHRPRKGEMERGSPQSRGFTLP